MQGYEVGSILFSWQGLPNLCGINKYQYNITANDLSLNSTFATYITVTGEVTVKKSFIEIIK